MRWALVKKRVGPKKGYYHEWKPILAEDCRYRCIYCSIHEAAFGGYRNFHVEHLRPKSKFPKHEHRYGNLFYACAVCNSLKGNDWPKAKQLDANVVCFPDPSVTDYSMLMSVAADSSRISGVSVAGRYLVERLYLNRPQLLEERRFAAIRAALEVEMGMLDTLIGAALPEESSRALAGELIAVVRLLNRYHEVRPYTASDIDR